MDTVTSISLLAALKNPDDASSWRRFDQRYRPMIAAFARKLGRQESDAADIAQDTIIAFVNAYRSGKYDHDKGRLRGWLFTVAYHCTVNKCKGDAKLPQAEGQSHIRRFLKDAASPDIAEGIWEAEWRACVLGACIDEARARVEPQNYEAFRLYVIEEIPAHVVAERLGITRATVYTAKSRFLERIREILPRMEENW